MEELASKYQFKDIEEKIYAFWEQQHLFSAQADENKKSFTIVIPPPNVTGILHMGHALNNTIQDILIRYKKMQGFNAVWMPGCDHAGIATQNVVERKIAAQGLKRQDLGREKFLEQVWDWKSSYGTTINQQLRRLGCACDWQRERFTMDTEYSNAVLEVFVHLYNKGLIYRGHYIINWCPRCQTALSDEEAPHKEVDGSLYFIKYPLKSSTKDYVVVATTRPETMLGDTAVAVNPKDERYSYLIGNFVTLPLMDREIKIVADDFVDMEFGTGAVKVTPAHDPNDYLIGKRHNLEFINILNPDGSLNKNAGAYAQMDRFKAREAVIDALRQKGLLLRVLQHKHAVGHCYRCGTMIEPYYSKQWFVKMRPLSEPAIKAVKDGEIKFYPKRWTKVYLNWMENIQDWCISRQIWWGHRLPVYYCRDCLKNLEDSNKAVIVSKTLPFKCPVCGSADIYQDNDVLDTWFSSWLWPFAVFGWPFNGDESAARIKQQDLKHFYPTSVLVTAQEIIFFWVARMVMAGFEFTKDIPFKDVYIHGTVRDDTGKKMSKSLGNSIDPLEVIADYGTDALRFSLISLTSMGQDVYLSKDKFEFGRNFANKIWNAARFLLMRLDESKDFSNAEEILKHKKLPLAEAWILSRFYSSLENIDKALSAYRFNEAANCLYEFFWHQFCDYYLELAKTHIHSEDIQFVLYFVLKNILLVLHPFIPFLTEQIWQKIAPNTGSIMLQKWPQVQAQAINRTLEANMGYVLEICTKVRNLRSESDIKPKQKIKVSIFVSNPYQSKLVKECTEYLKVLAKIEQLTLLNENAAPDQLCVSAAMPGTMLFMHVGDFDLKLEIKKNAEEIIKMNKYINRKSALLNNMQFVRNAPFEVVEKETQDCEKLKEKLNKLIQRQNELERAN
ncbi:MAG: valine--tRNA ligase [Candidatus Omnitrophota bacterium]|nr:MAG: valine--tRNA ligase [Candidatus Omnitrophota bacterium]